MRTLRVQVLKGFPKSLIIWVAPCVWGARNVAPGPMRARANFDSPARPAKLRLAERRQPAQRPALRAAHASGLELLAHSLFSGPGGSRILDFLPKLP